MSEEWRDAPIIVAKNATKDAINVRATMAFAERTGRALHWYHAIDKHKNSVIRDVDLIVHLEAQHYIRTNKT